MVMKKEIEKLKEKADLSLHRKSNISVLIEEFKEITMTLAADVHTERNMFELRQYQHLIDLLNSIRKRNSLIERQTKLPFYNLVQAYHLSLYFTSLRYVLKDNKSPEFEKIDEIMEDVDFILEEGKKVISKFHHQMLERKANETKQAIIKRLSRIDRLLNRFMRKKAAELSNSKL
jgi:phenylpyruvate tautomerase PptA (4-oxalocrotonate tautomerase family)